jgi:hypothetical protein
MSLNRVKCLWNVVVAFVLVVGLVSLAGCAGSGVDQASATVTGGGPQTAPVMTGLVHGGNLPVSGGVIQLWSVGTGGYGSAPTPLVSTSNSYYPGGVTGCTASTSSITAFSITSNIVTFTATSTVVPPVYSYVTISGLSSSAGSALDGQTLIVTSSSSSQFTAAFTASNVSSTPDTGTATEVCQSNVITNYAGGFTLSPGNVLSYTCTAGTMIYLTATGGNPGLGEIPTTSTSANNTALAMMTPIGNCNKLTTNGTSNNGSITFVDVNEVTTIVAVYALQNYIGITPGTTLSSTLTSSTPAFRIGAGAVGSKSYQGLTNAFELAGDLVNISNGVAAGTTSGSSSPYTPVTNGSSYTAEFYQIDMLANVLAGCVNNSSSSATGCATLFNYATPPGTSNTPADTLQATWDMAQNPTNNAANIAGLATSQAAFSPFASAVNDLTIGASIAIPHPTTPGYYMYRGFQTAVDGFGNLWVSSTGGVGGGTVTTNLVAEFDPAGQPLGVTTQYNTGSVGSPTLASFSPSQPASGENSGYAPMSISIDPSNNVWVADFMDSQIVEIPASSGPGVVSEGLTTTSSSGSPAKYNLAYALPVNSYPSTIASDSSGNIYVASQGESYTTTPVPPAIVGLTAASIAQYGYNGTVSAGPLTSATEFTASTGPGQALNGMAATTATAIPTSSDEVATIPTATSGQAIGYPLLSVVLDYSSGYRGGPLAWIPDPQACSAYGQILQIFGTTDSSTTPNVKQGEATPLSLMSNSTQTSCKVSNTTVGTVLETPITTAATSPYNGTNYTTYGPTEAFAAAIDPSSNVWTLNTKTASATAGYPAFSLSKLTPTYHVTSGVLSGTVAALTTTSGALPNMFGTSNSGNRATTFAIDSAGNVWLSPGGSVAVVPETNHSGNYTSTAAFVEFNNSGTDISSQYYQSANSTTPSTATPTVPATTSQFGYIGAYPLYSGSALVGLSYRDPIAHYNVAIDLGGTLWSAYGTSNGNSFNIMLGGAAPTLAPISLGNPSKP